MHPFLRHLSSSATRLLFTSFCFTCENKKVTKWRWKVMQYYQATDEITAEIHDTQPAQRH